MELDDFCDTISSMYDFSFDRNKELKGYDFIMESVSDVRLFKRLVLVLKFYYTFMLDLPTVCIHEQRHGSNLNSCIPVTFSLGYIYI